MLIFTSPYFLCAALTLAGLGASHSAQAQNAIPAWQSAVSIGTGSSFVGDMDVDAAGNTYELGSFSGTTVVAGTALESRGGQDVYLAKYTPTGTLAWVRQLGSSGSESAMALTLDAAGNAYITGGFDQSVSLGNGLTLDAGSLTYNSRKLYVVRYSPQGTPEWAQQSVNMPTTSSVGSDIGLDAAGNVYVSGLTTTTVTVGSATLEASASTYFTFVARFASATGTLHYLRKGFEYVPYTPTSTNTYFYPRIAVGAGGEISLGTTFNANLVISGTTHTARGLNDVLVAKYTAAGTTEWVQQMGGANNDYIRAMVVSAAGDTYVSGYFAGPATFGTAATAITLPGAGDYDGFLVKLTASGPLAWVQTIAGPGSDTFSSLALDAAGNSYVTGSFTTSASVGTTQLVSAGGTDAIVAAYSPQGQLRWTQQAGGTALDYGSHLGFSTTGDLYVLGRFNGVCSFGALTLPGPAAAATTETFLARLGTAPLAARPARALPLGLYPNPATHWVHLPTLTPGTAVQLLDALGHVARTTTLSAAAQVSVQGLRAGLYTLRATDAQGRQLAGKVVVE